MSRQENKAIYFGFKEHRQVAGILKKEKVALT